MRSPRFVSAALLLACSAHPLRAQEMPGMDMSSSATAMSGDEMPMSHMTMTKRMPARAGDAVRAAAIADTLGRAIQKDGARVAVGAGSGARVGDAR
ncbi:MAG: hypothetical protein M3Y30_14015 [Gemmatimonadota bacterium]|nr:hypothetical protein [Gemmatimonadota bacterium]